MEKYCKGCGVDITGRLSDVCAHEDCRPHSSTYKRKPETDEQLGYCDDDGRVGG